MKSYIEILEQIGQTGSLQQHDTLQEMLKINQVSNGVLDTVNTASLEHVCILLYPTDPK